jgi:hypothetical protein
MLLPGGAEPMPKSLTEVQIARFRDEGSPIFKMLPLSNPVFTASSPTDCQTVLQPYVH